MRNIIVLVVTVLVIAAVATAHSAKMPKGAFLKYPVSTVEQLSQQVIDDAIVATRYAKHYATPRNAVVDYFQRNLRIARLTKDYETTVYHISERTNIVSGKKVLPKGSYVFVTINGTPMLEGSTGNPLGNYLPIALNNTNTTSVTGSTFGTGELSPSTSMNDGVVTKVLSAQPLGLEAITTEPAYDLVTYIPTSSTADTILGSTNLKSLIVPAAAVIGGAALASSGGDDKNTSSPTSVEVPEPASIMALALGASGIVLPRIRRRR